MYGEAGAGLLSGFCIREHVPPKFILGGRHGGEACIQR